MNLRIYKFSLRATNVFFLPNAKMASQVNLVRKLLFYSSDNANTNHFIPGHNSFVFLYTFTLISRNGRSKMK